MNKISVQYFKTRVGDLIVGSFKDRLCLCDWQYRRMRTTIDKRIQKGLNAHYEEEETSVIKEAKKQLEEYLHEKRKEFDIPLQMVGTAFQQKVWQELLKIPFGKTENYLGLSQKIDNEKAVRAVASANGANALAIFAPCHRIIGSDGELVGYAGGLNTKKKLLHLENSYTFSEQIPLFEI